MAQQNIDFGTFPDDPDADAIRIAFQKTQNNFTELYTSASEAGVTSVNRSAGAGITVDTSTGNVTVTANIACVQVRTTSLSIGIGGNGNLSANYTSSGQLLYIDLPTNIQSTGNVQANGFVSSNANISAVGNIVGGNLTTSGILSVTGNANVSGNINLGGNLVVGGVIVANVTGSANTAGTVTTAAQPNITSVGTLTTLGVNGTITAVAVTANTGVFTGNGSGLSQLAGANVSGAVSYATTANSVAGANVSGEVNYAAVANSVALANVSGIGNIASLNLDGNASNILYGNGSFAAPSTSIANATYANNAGNAYSVAGSNVSGEVSFAATANGVAGGNVSGQVNYAATANSVAGSNVSGAVSYATTANSVAGANVSGQVAYANVANNVAGANVSGQVNYAATANSVAGANVSGQVGNALIAGTVYTNAQPNITSVGTLTSANVTGDITVGNIYANSGTIQALNFVGNGAGLTNVSVSAGTYIENGNSNVRVSANSNVYVSVNGVSNVVNITDTNLIINGNVTANDASLGNLVTANFANVVLTSAASSQPNIRTVGSLTGLTSTGTINFTTASNVSLGSNANLHISGGLPNAFLMTDGGGNLVWDTATLVPAQGANTQVIFNDGGSNYAGSSNLTFSANSLLSLTGNANVTGNINVTGDIQQTNGQIIVVSGTKTANAPAILLTQTWNNSSSVFNGIYVNITDTASDATSNIADFRIGGVSKFNITKAGNVSFAGVIAGNGSGLSAIAGANVTGAVTYATTANSVAGANVSGAVSFATTANAVAGANVSGQVGNALVSGTVYTNAQPNITSVGTLTSLSVTGNISGANLTGTHYGAATGLTSIPGANVSGTVANATYAVSSGTAGAVTTNAQPNITSVGTLSSLTASGNIQGGNVITTGYHIRSVDTSLSANGSTQTDATALVKEFNIVSTVSSGQGVKLPVAVAGMAINIVNTSANSLLVYPATNGIINSQSANASLSMPTKGSLQFIASSATQWYTVGSTYA